MEKSLYNDYKKILQQELSSPNFVKEAPLKDLEYFAQNIRKFLLECTHLYGGHLSSNLGVVEMTLALHRAFDFPKDQILFDVGHQAYTHKILTGRLDQFDTLRQKDGLSGFVSPKESDCDTFHAGHASTALSLAAGIARAKKQQHISSYTIALVGDGALTGGIAYEALNTIAYENLPVLILINDNGMSISKNVGGIFQHLEKFRMSPLYQNSKAQIKELLTPSLIDLSSQIKDEFAQLILPRKDIFNSIGIRSFGPFDGNNLSLLYLLFSWVKEHSLPLALHLVTKKGKGDFYSENNPTKTHGVGAYTKIKKEGQTFSQVFGSTMLEFAKKDKKLYVVTPAMIEGSGLLEYSKFFPKQLSDVGITEENALLYSVGLSLGNLHPVLAIYSTFLQRSYDQLLHDVGIAQTKVVFAIDRAGLVPGDGKTHQGVFDISFLRTVPGMKLLFVATKKELKKALFYALYEQNSPIAVRYTKSIAKDCDQIDQYLDQYGTQDGILLYEGNKKDLIISLGEQSLLALEVHESDPDIAVYHLQKGKYFSQNTLALFRQYKRVVILEEGIYNGSVSQEIKEYLYYHQIFDVYAITIGDEYPVQATRAELLEQYGFTKQHILSLLRK